VGKEIFIFHTFWVTKSKSKAILLLMMIKLQIWYWWKLQLYLTFYSLDSWESGAYLLGMEILNKSLSLIFFIATIVLLHDIIQYIIHSHITSRIIVWKMYLILHYLYGNSVLGEPYYIMNSRCSKQKTTDEIEDYWYGNMVTKFVQRFAKIWKRCMSNSCAIQICNSRSSWSCTHQCISKCLQFQIFFIK
jgi:hypothetical protein